MKSEDRELSEFHIWLWNTKPETRRLCYHPFNEGMGNGAMKMAKGVVSGIPDYCIDIPNSEFIGLRLEFKIAKQKQSDKQVDAMHKLRAMGFCYHVVFSSEEARKVTEEYLESAPLQKLRQLMQP